MKTLLTDSFGRVARKLRISLTDRCNMRCKYCMPQNDVKWFEKSEVLLDEEIARLAEVMSRMGIIKVRLTGGEPLLRSNLDALICSLSIIPKIETISMTSNGLLLGERAVELANAGLQSVNVSLDTLNASRFKSITGIDGLSKVLSAIDIAADAGLEVKINSVIVRGWNDNEVADLALYARETGYPLRFIEFMPLDGSGIWAGGLVFGKDEMISKIENKIGKLRIVARGKVKDKYNESDPATLYEFVDGKGGLVGFIPSITEPFCDKCDRIRITSDGRLLTCLYENPGHDLKSALRGGKTDEEIAQHIAQCMTKKPEGIIRLIRLNELKPNLNQMHTIGG